MAMDFFEQQERARRKTGRLVFLFAAAVIAIIVLVYLVVAAVLANASGGGDVSIWRVDLLLGVSTAVIAVVALGSLYKLNQLRGGGRVVAESLGGRLLDSGSSDPDERKLLNVVEEMAIASGVPVPPVYLMENERAINAFAAGFSPDDAVIGVTRGCVELLDRDELQGVIAHEFSHVLNGDMRLNIRLIGILHGILVIALIGQVVLRSIMYSGSGRRSRSSNKKGGGGIIAILAIGAALLVIGYVGYFFGGLIKAAVSRQREFLADASAVQFTRYPKGIGGALKKIGGYTLGSNMLSPRASEVSHMFFGQGVKSWLGAVSATHPPLEERIRRIQPDWDGVFAEASVTGRAKEKTARKPAKRPRGPAGIQAVAGLAAMTGAPGETPGASPGAIPGAGTAPGAGVGRGDLGHDTAPVEPALKQLGSLNDRHIAYARDLLNSIPEALTEATRSTFGACAVVYALLLDADQQIASRQLQTLRDLSGGPVAEAADTLRPAIDRMDASARLPLIDMAMPALHGLSPDQYKVFQRCVGHLVGEDKKIDLFEWVLSRVLIRRLAPAFEAGRRKDRRVRFTSLKPVSRPLSVLLSTLARYGQEDAKKVRAAFDAGAAELGLDPGPELLDKSHCGLRQLAQAVETLMQVGPREKRKVVHACAACIVADKRVTVNEGELLRAVAESLGCPMPPLLPGQPVV
jgi:Zn-dependent protease with chaperone function